MGILKKQGVKRPLKRPIKFLNIQTRTDAAAEADLQLVLGSIQNLTKTIKKLEKSHLQSLALQEKYIGILEKMEKKFTERTVMVNMTDQKVGPGEDEAIEPGFVFVGNHFVKY